MKKIVVLLVVIVCISFLLKTCHGHAGATKKQSSIETVALKNSTNTLYYSGNLIPANQVSVISPNDGVVVEQKFNYGQVVQQGQPLFVINSTKQASDFQQALAGYLKAKETLNTSQGNLQNTKRLYAKGLVSRDEYEQARSDYYTNELSYMQAQQQLQQTTTFYKSDTNILALSIEDIRQISKELNQSSEIKNIIIRAPGPGIALFPIASGSSGGDSGSGGVQKVSVGSQVKQGQLLLTISHADSLSIKVQASQIDVNQLKVGLPATITSMAFPNITLDGYIANIDAQATSDSNSLPVFNMEIFIPHLTEQAKKVVKIGMSAKAAINIVLSSRIMIPINAVSQVNGNAVVEKIVNGKPVSQIIQTGQTTEDSVVVTSGLKPGDKILVSH